jgi:hypothetical protein
MDANRFIEKVREFTGLYLDGNVSAENSLVMIDTALAEYDSEREKLERAAFLGSLPFQD